MKKSIIAGALLLAMSTAGASASTVTYNFSGGANPSGPFTLGCSVGGLLNSGCTVTYNAQGLGVNGVPDTQPGQIDDWPFSFEALVVSFTNAVKLESFRLGSFNAGNPDYDKYEYSLNGGSYTSYLTANPAVIGQVVTSFAVKAVGGSLFNPNDFTLKSFTVSSVPLPAGALLLASAMGGLALLRRRNRGASAA